MILAALALLLAPLGVPQAPGDAPEALSGPVWAALTAHPTKEPIRPVPGPPGDAPRICAREGLSGLLWAELVPGGFRLRLYRHARRWVVEVDLRVEPGVDSEALRQAVALKLDYLFESTGGRAWPRAAPPPLPAPAEPPSDARMAELAPPPRPGPPTRPPAVVPALPPPLPPPRPGTQVQVLRAPGAREPKDSRSDTISVARPGGKAGPRARRPWRARGGGEALADAEHVEAGIAVSLGFFPRDELGAALALGVYPFRELDGESAVALRVGVQGEYRVLPRVGVAAELGAETLSSMGVRAWRPSLGLGLLADAALMGPLRAGVAAWTAGSAMELEVRGEGIGRLNARILGYLEIGE